jgi:EmrB/QacA subfamily drug resistance transporter
MAEQNRKWWILSVAAAGVLLSTIDASIVNIALPTISEHFNSSVRNTAWVTISYLLVITVTLLLFGRLSDIYGQKLIFTGGLLIFTASSGLCALSGSITMLIIFRSIQGIGAAMIVSNTTAIVTNAFPPAQRGTGLGVIGAVVSVGLMSGPPLGGMIIHYFGWQYIFMVNLPVGLGAILLTLKILPEFKGDRGAALFHPADLILWIAGITILIIGFRVSGNISTMVIDLIMFPVVSALILTIFFMRQGNAVSPLLRPSILGNRVFLFASLAGLFSYMTMISLTFMLPFLLEYSFGKSPLESGRILMMIPATTVVASPLSGYLSDRFGQRPIASLGTFLSTLSILFMFFITPASPIIQLVAGLVVFGIGLGMFGSPNNSAMMGSVDIKDRGSAGGILATVRNLGMVSGMGIISVIYNSGLAGGGESTSMAYFAAFRHALPVVTSFSLVALIFSGLRKSVS